MNKIIATNAPEPSEEDPESEPILSLKEKLAEVAADCGYVRKDGVNQFHKYNYATAATIFEKVGESLYRHRLVSKPKFRIEESTTRQNSKGQTETLVTVEVTLTVADLDSELVVELNGFGSGMDNSDKAVMKAQTAALKYAWMMGLNISTGDDPEADATVDTRAEGKPLAKAGPRGPYKPSDAVPSVVPPGPGYGDDPNVEELEPDPEPPGIFGPPSGPPMTKAQLAAAAGHAVIEEGGSPKEAVVRISEELNESLGQCPCGSPLIEKVTKPKKDREGRVTDPGGKRYKTCELNDKAFGKDKWAMARINDLEVKGVCPADGHTWKWAK